MTITTFDDLLAAARAQPEPQRLLLVFAGAGPGSEPTPAQQSAFEQGHGGELTPLMCVDKGLDELADFAALVEQSRLAGPPWAIVFAAALSGTAGAPADSRTAEAPLQRMVDNIRSGVLANMIAFDTAGQAVTLD